MAFNDTQQFQHLVENSKHILLVLNAEQSIDSICAALACKKFFEKQHKQVDVVAQDFLAPKNLKFLKDIESVLKTISNLQKFIIKVDVSNIKIDTLSYDIKDNWLSIYPTPKQGIITRNEIRTAQSNFKYDMIITAGAQDLESLGDIFFTNTDLFYRLPLVNIDNHPSNEHFGQINMVELTATSVSEIVYKALTQLGEGFIDEDIATALLTGMISQTQSFKSNNVTPYTLTIASQLMNLGADREKIVQQLYRTKSISSLKIWGQALTHMESDPAIGMIWTTITREDFARSGGHEEELKGLIDELINTSPEAKIILLVYEDPKNNDIIKGFISVDRQHDAKLLVQAYHPEGNKKSASFSINGKSLKEAELELTDAIRKAARSNH